MNNFITKHNKLFFIIFLLLVVLIPSLISVFQKPNMLPSPYPSSTPFIKRVPPPAPSVSPEYEQGLRDEEFNNLLGSFNQAYPWYNNLPPQNDNYFIIFSGSRKSFIVELYPKKISSLSIDTQITSLKQLVEDKLTSLGVNLKTYAFDWQVYPQ